MLQLAAFADEISPDLDEQIRVCLENGVRHIELRGVNHKNVLDFDRPMRQEIKSKVDSAGMRIAVIGSPIGKVKINEPWSQHFDRFKIAVELAEFFGAPMIRIFSYYPPDKDDEIRRYRDEVLRRMAAKVDYVKHMNVVIVHENERDIYGEKGPECLDIVVATSSPKLRNVFDFANYVVCGESAPDCWRLLKPYTTHIHVKDAIARDGKVVPAGQGDGHVGEILADAYKSGYRGLLSLEPHLSAAGQFSGFSGPSLFKTAADALKDVCRKFGIPLAL